MLVACARLPEKVEHKTAVFWCNQYQFNLVESIKLFGDTKICRLLGQFGYSVCFTHATNNKKLERTSMDLPFVGDSVDRFVAGFISTAATIMVLAFCVGVVVVIFLYIIDITQTEHAIRRNYPVVGRFRYFFEHLGEFFRQYLIIFRMAAIWLYKLVRQNTACVTKTVISLIRN